MLTTRTCRLCSEVKSPDEFTKNGKYLRTECLVCYREAKRRYHTDNRDTILAKKRTHYVTRRRNAKLQENYGITLDTYNDMLLAQNNVCAICGEGETRSRNGVTMPLAVDHNHSNNRVRELLCNRCNAGLGFFREDSVLMEKAIEYLRKWNTLESDAG